MTKRNDLLDTGSYNWQVTPTSTIHDTYDVTIPTQRNYWTPGNIYDSMNTYRDDPILTKSDHKVVVQMEDGAIESVTREEMIKYIGERQIIQENELVRKMYERYQVALKLARSDDNGDRGV